MDIKAQEALRNPSQYEERIFYVKSQMQRHNSRDSCKGES